MTREETRKRIRELNDLMWQAEYGEEYDKLYEEYCKLNAIEDRIYREENEPRLIAFFEENIKGKTWQEINQEDWDFYSDYHKDVYGCRPRNTKYCG